MKRQSKVIANYAPLQAMTADVEANRRARVKIGVLANKAERYDINKTKQDDLNNPTIGLIHEYGSLSLGIPARSWLRMPIELELPKKMAPLGRKVWAISITSKGLIHALEVLGAMAEQTIQMAFSTGVFGRWRPLSAYTIRKKGSSAILIDSAQLRRGVSWAIVGGAKP